MKRQSRPARPAIDLSMAFAAFLTSLGCKVHAEGTAIIGQDGKPYLDAWTYETTGRARAELSSMDSLKTALLSLAGAMQENAAE